MREHPLKRLRVRELGMSLRDFAEPLQVSHQYVHQVETGTEPLGRRAALEVVRVYGRDLTRAKISVLDLLSGGERSKTGRASGRR